tara:strand:+ start:136 stop:465 length:330 start_codon:yes stop_codon:yes gene_type:complete
VLRPWQRYSPVLFMLGIAGLFVWAHVRAHVEYARIEHGMKRSEVIRRLGEPRRTAADLVFCVTTVRWTGKCPGPEFGGSFLYYKYGVARWVIVGIDRTGSVGFKTLGDT